MDRDLQTSFIPKKPLVEERVMRTRKVSIFNFLATLIFFASLVSAGGMYFYKANLTQSIAKMKADLERAKDAFEPGVIEDLEKLDRRLNATVSILDEHITVSPIFALIEESTLSSVQFTKFDYEMPSDATGDVKVTLTGIAPGYEAIALQNDAYASEKSIKNPKFSNLELDQRGRITFDVEFYVERGELAYEPNISMLDNTSVMVPVENQTLTTTNTQ